MLTALSREPPVSFLPQIVASSTGPVPLITRLVPGVSLFEAIDSTGPDRVGRQLAWFLPPRTPLRRGRRTLPAAQLSSATTQTLRERFGTLVRPDQRRIIMRRCDWADAVLAAPVPAVLVHSDLHGDN